MRKKSTG